MARKYPQKGYVKSKRFVWNNGKNYITIPIEQLIWNRLSANNSRNRTVESSVASLDRIKMFKNVSPYLDEFGRVVSFADPGFAPCPTATLDQAEFVAMLEDCNRSMYGKLKQFKDNFNAANFIGERKQTIEMVGNRLGQLYQLYRKARKPLQTLEMKAARYPRNINIKKELADKRLEYSFGWAPLMSDIHAACHAFPPPVDIAFGTTRVASHNIEVETPTEFTTMNGTFKCSVRAKLQVDAPLVASASSLGLDNPATVLWELTPWSFVVDWVLPVGTYIENLTALNGYSITDAGVTFGAIGVGTLRSKGNKSYATTVYRRQNRIPFEFQNPPLKLQNPFSISHVINSMALISQLKSRPTKHYEYTE